MQIHGLQDATAYEIKYDARVVLETDTDFGGDGWNKVDISPIVIPGENQSSTELTGTVLEATAGGESESLKVSIYGRGREIYPLLVRRGSGTGRGRHTGGRRSPDQRQERRDRADPGGL